MTEKEIYNSNKYKTKGTDYKITLSGMNGRSFNSLSEEFHNVLTNIYDDIMQNVRDRDIVRFVVLSKDLDTNINSPYQQKRNTSGLWLSNLIAKSLQSHQNIDLDNNFTLHVQVIA